MFRDLRHSYAIIDLKALENNINEIKRIAGKRKIISIIKDNAYGHGALKTIEIIDNFSDLYGVANIKEALRLRRYTDKPFLILGGFFPNEVKHFDNNLMPVVYDLESLNMLSKTEKPLNIHLEFDTGMGRTGFSFDEIYSIEKILKTSKKLKIKGVMAHLACAESDETYTKKQINRFYSIIEKLKKSGINFDDAHISNSAGMFYELDDVINAVRPGIMIYGSYPSSKYKKLINLKPVMTFKGQIIYIKSVEKNTPISYGCTFKTTKKSLIATVSAGYGDGYPRNLSNKGLVYIEGKGLAPVVGTVCMDMFMIDITNIPNVNRGDSVVLWGEGHEEVHPDRVAKRADTISYELFCHLSERVKKVYKR
ncbi:MAG: alanine racemase [Proteobacteria bacterium]|nr:alanine racemase [Pseudomonadota bacterium]